MNNKKEGRGLSPRPFSFFRDIYLLCITTISDSVFHCSGLTDVVIPDSVTTIENGAFYECSALKNVTIGNGVKSIGGWAFSFCLSLTSVTFEKTEGWKAGDTSLLATDLANTATAADYLKYRYYSYIWTRTEE